MRTARTTRRAGPGWRATRGVRRIRPRATAPLLLEAPAPHRPERAHDRIVLDGADDLLAGEQDVGLRIERQEVDLVRHDLVALAVDRLCLARRHCPLTLA